MYGTGAVYNSRIIGNRIAADTTPSPCGGGIFMNVGPNTNYTVGGLVENCLIADNICTNSTTYGGGGVFVKEIGTVRNCVISNNQGCIGGGVTLSAGGILTNCVITDNISLGSAGGIYMRTIGSVVTDCVISNNQGNSRGGGIYMSAVDSQVVRSIITHNWSTNSDGGGIAILVRGLVDGCTIEYNRSDGLGNQGGGGVYIKSGRIINSTIRYNQAALNGGGISMWLGGVVSNCVIEGNLASTNSSALGGGIYALKGGLVTHSRIISNTCWSSGGGVYGNEGGVMINCLIAGNTASNSGGGLYANHIVISNGSVQSCTFADNESVTGSGGGIYVNSTNYFINTIVYSNRASSAEDNDVGVYPGSNPASVTNSFHYCCTTRDLSTANQNNITNAPGFVSFAQNNFRLASGSPCINTGTNEAWMAQGIDLDGRPRLDRLSGLVDMGCYEHIPRGTFFRFY